MSDKIDLIEDKVNNMDIDDEQSVDDDSGDENNYSLEDLNSIRDSIEHMSKVNQIEILKILNKNNCIINENKYGIHINLTGLSCSIIEELKKFISYVTIQEQTLNQVEKLKENYKNKYFTKDNKEISCNNTKKDKDVKKSKLQY